MLPPVKTPPRPAPPRPLPNRPTWTPVKHVRYPYSRPWLKGDTVTIAAGILYRGGVLLCADTEGQTDSNKGLLSKVGFVKCQYGTIASAMAGNVDYASTAIQRIERKFEQGECRSIDEVAEFLRHSYEQNIFQHPLYQSYPDSFKYSLLLAICFTGDPTVRLYVTNEGTIRETKTYRCEGIGRDVGHSVIMNLYRPEMGEDRAIALASYTLAKVKRSVPGCGGPSLVVCVTPDGPDLKTSEVISHIENVCGWFDQSSSEFLLAHTCGSDADFEELLSGLVNTARKIRSLWRERLASLTTKSTP